MRPRPRSPSKGTAIGTARSWVRRFPLAGMRFFITTETPIWDPRIPVTTRRSVTVRFPIKRRSRLNFELEVQLRYGHAQHLHYGHSDIAKASGSESPRLR